MLAANISKVVCPDLKPFDSHALWRECVTREALSTVADLNQLFYVPLSEHYVAQAVYLFHDDQRSVTYEEQVYLTKCVLWIVYCHRN